MMMRFKFPGRAHSPEIYQDRLHHHQEEDEMAKACMLTFLLSGWQMITKTLYHSSWPYGLSSLLTDYIKKKNYNSKEMGKMPKPLLICPKPFQHVGDPIYGKINRDVAC